MDHNSLQTIMNIVQIILTVILIPTIRFFWDVKIFIEKEAYINKFLLENLEKRLDNLEKRFDTAEKNNAKEIHELKQNIKEIENEKGY